MTKVYVDLDVLIDGRAALAKQLDPDALRKWGRGWHNRIHEHDPDVRFGTSYTYSEFNKAWDERDAESILRDSIPTRMMWQLGFLIADWQKNQKVGFVNPNFTLVVNTYPYEFTDEAKGGLLAGVANFIGPEDNVELIYRNPTTIYPTEIRATFTMMVMDRVDLWLAENAKHLEDNPIPNVLFVTKKLALLKPDPMDDLVKMFEALEMMHSVLMFYRCFSMDWFSYFIPEQPPHQESPPQSDPLAT